MDNLDKLKTDFIELRQQVVEKLINNHISISTCESATAGSIASNICDVPGASKVLSEAYVVYSNDAKKKILGIDDDLIKKYGVVSCECALAMACGLRKITNSDICVSITGNLGPDVLEEKPAGLVFAGFIYKDKQYVKEYRFFEDRLKNKFLVVNQVFMELSNILANM